MASQEAIVRKLWRVEGVQGVAATLSWSFKPEEERHDPTTRLPDTIQVTWSELPGLEFPLPSGRFSPSVVLTGRLPQPGWSSLTFQRGSGLAGPTDVNEAVIGYELAWDLIQTFLAAQFRDTERYRRRLAKVATAVDLNKRF